jgi:hypothetical protein
MLEVVTAWIWHRAALKTTWANVLHGILQRPITFKIFLNLLTPTSLSFNMRLGSRRPGQRRTVAGQAMKTSLLATEGYS